MLTRLTKWMVTRYLPDHILLKTVDIAVIETLLKKHAPGHHLRERPSHKKARRLAAMEAMKDAIKECQEETLGD